jgi:hypothetical protein
MLHRFAFKEQRRAAKAENHVETGPSVELITMTMVVQSGSADSGPDTLVPVPEEQPIAMLTKQSGDVSKHAVGCAYTGVVRESGVPATHQHWVVHSKSAEIGPGTITLIPAQAEELPGFDPVTGAPVNNATRRVSHLG